VLFLHRISQSVQVDQPDTLGSAEGEGGNEEPVDRDTVVFRISGAFFFGAAATVAAALDRIGEPPSR
jgi:SulP family sulfate permease